MLIGQDIANESLVQGEPYSTSGKEYPYDLNCKEIFRDIPSLSVNIYWMIKRTKDAQGEITNKMANEMRPGHKEVMEYTLQKCNTENIFLMGKGVAWEFDKMFNTRLYDHWTPLFNKEWSSNWGIKTIHLFPHP